MMMMMMMKYLDEHSFCAVDTCYDSFSVTPE